MKKNNNVLRQQDAPRRASPRRAILEPYQLAYRRSKEVPLEDYYQQTDLFTQSYASTYKKITQEEIDESPDLQQIYSSIESTQEQVARIEEDTYQRRYLKKNLIELRKDQYVARSSSKPMMHPRKIVRSQSPHTIPVSETVTPQGTIVSTGVSLTDEKVCAAILKQYSRLKDQCAESPHTDLWALMLDFDALMERALQRFPVLKRIVILKIDKTPNEQIRTILMKEFNCDYSKEYISNVWLHRIPRIISKLAQVEYTEWYFTYKARGNYKKCNKCGQIKLAHTMNFPRNRAAPDGFYSICKECRRKK